MKRPVVCSTLPAYPVAGAGNVLQLLLLLQERQCIRLTDVSTELGIGRSTAHRLLAMFRQFDFVEQDARGQAYRVGPGLLAASKTLVARQLTLMRIRPILESLREELDETLHVATLRGSTVVYVDCLESRKVERATPRTGRVMPAHATAAGKALLAGLTRAAIEALYPSEVLVPLTSHTLATRTALLDDIDRVRGRGFALSENEGQLGFIGCSCAIAGAAGSEPTAIVIAAPSRRFRKGWNRFVEHLGLAAVQIARA